MLLDDGFVGFISLDIPGFVQLVHRRLPNESVALGEVSKSFGPRLLHLRVADTTRRLKISVIEDLREIILDMLLRLSTGLRHCSFELDIDEIMSISQQIPRYLLDNTR